MYCAAAVHIVTLIRVEARKWDLQPSRRLKLGSFNAHLTGAPITGPGHMNDQPRENFNSGALSRNETREDERHSEYRGSASIECPTCKVITPYYMDGWVRQRKSDGGKFFSIRFKPKNQARERDSGGSSGSRNRDDGGNYSRDRNRGPNDDRDHRNRVDDRGSIRDEIPF